MKGSGDVLDNFFKLVENVLRAIERGEPVPRIKGRIGMGGIGLSYGFSLGLGLSGATPVESEHPYEAIPKGDEVPIELIKQGQRTTVLAQIPEVKEEDVAVQLKEHSILVSVSRKQGPRIWEIPCDTRTKVVSARCKNGVLEIVLKKRNDLIDRN